MYWFFVGNSTPVQYICTFIQCLRSIQVYKKNKNKMNCYPCRRFSNESIRVCVCVPTSTCLVFLPPHRNSVPPPLCVIVLMSADCRLLWCLHLSSIWPMLSIWPGLIVLMVTPASCPQVGRPNSGPDIMKEM